MGRLESLRDKHAKIDAEIIKLQSQLGCCNLALSQLKKRKLFLKDQIAALGALSARGVSIPVAQRG